MNILLRVHAFTIALLFVLPIAVADESDSQAKKEKAPSAGHRKLLSAVRSGSIDRVKELIASGANLNEADSAGMTALLAARIAGYRDVAEVLEKAGADAEVVKQFDPAKFASVAMKSDGSIDRPGAAILIARGDKVLFVGTAGAENIEAKKPVTAKTKFRIGSVSKQFTAAAILKLQESGKLSVTDTLDKFIADFPRGDEVTLHHMLTHTSGMKNYTSEPNFYDNVTTPVDTKTMLEHCKSIGYGFDPGQRFEYCNTGYYLLSYVVEQASGSSFEAYLQKTFFDPIGMSDTGVHHADGNYDHEALGYSVSDGNVELAIDWDMSWAQGAGSLYSTVGDLHKWNMAIFRGKVLGPQSLKAAHTVHPATGAKESPESGAAMQMPYGYGWVMDEFRGLKRISHGGGLQGFVSQLSYFPAEDVSVVAFHNAFPSVQAFTPALVANRLTEVFLFTKMDSRESPRVDPNIDTETYDQYVGKYDYPGAVMTVTRKGTQLMAQLTGQPEFQIYPSGDDKFFWKVVDAKVEFQRDKDGKVVSAKHSQGPANFVAPRIKARKVVELSDALIDRFTGVYKYNALAELTVRRDKSRLFAKMTGQQENEVFPMSETKLFWKVINAELELDLDENGGINGAIHYQSGQKIPVEKIK